MPLMPLMIPFFCPIYSSVLFILLSYDSLLLSVFLLTVFPFPRSLSVTLFLSSCVPFFLLLTPHDIIPRFRPCRISMKVSMKSTMRSTMASTTQLK